MEHKPYEWRLFLDGSNKSFKAVLLHNTNRLPSVLVYYAVGKAEKREVIEIVLQCIQHDQYMWLICSDLKLVSIILGMIPGNSKSPCFLCTWDHNGKTNIYFDPSHSFIPRGDPMVGKFSHAHMPLEHRNRILIPPLHVKLGLVTNFLKTLSEESRHSLTFRSFSPTSTNEAQSRYDAIYE